MTSAEAPEGAGKCWFGVQMPVHCEHWQPLNISISVELFPTLTSAVHSCVYLCGESLRRGVPVPQLWPTTHQCPDIHHSHGLTHQSGWSVPAQPTIMDLTTKCQVDTCTIKCPGHREPCIPMFTVRCMRVSNLAAPPVMGWEQGWEQGCQVIALFSVEKQIKSHFI
ncbi:unnamed protein product [Oppiella nova]|uniref:Uncharacterized protein n=1 Tax=Oppiella nova TaxID=334625 RepID=A0A7R9LMU5_9ACAR|nr:unnamed protein product [Oppiella nova]CAG2164522.1 unnamed protein product [Oppiella nova]